MKTFENFTNLYPLPRTLRFELKPLYKTKELIDSKQELFPKDKRIDEIYQNIIKPCLNELHSDFIEKSMENKDFQNIPDNILKIYSNEKNIDDFKNIEKDLIKQINWFLKSNKTFFAENYSDLLGKNSIDIIIKVFWEKIYKKDDSWKIFLYNDLLWKSYEELINIYFKWFSTYLSNFNKNRENLYDKKNEAKIWSVSGRTIWENFPRFLQNCINFRDKLEKLNLSIEQKDIFITNNFWKYISQKQIDYYNKIIWQINSKTNEFNQKNGLKWNKKLPKLLLLHKQILWKSENENILNFVNNIIQTDFELEQEIKIINKDIFQRIDFIKKSIVSNIEDFELEKIFIKKNRLKDISSLLMDNYSVLEKLLPEFNEEWKIIKENELVNLSKIKKSFENIDLKDLKNIFKKEYFDESKDWFKLFLNWIYNHFSDLENNIKHTHKLVQDKLISWNFSENIQKSEKNINLRDEIFVSSKWLLKAYLDSILALDRFVHMFDYWEQKDFDSNFYNNIEEYSINFSPFKTYNAVRNYLTKKNYSTDKIKLNFDYPDFLGSNSLWKYAFIYKDSKWFYYLWVLDHSNSQSKYKPQILKNNTEFYQLEYKQIKFNTLAWKWYIRDFWVKYSEDENCIINLKTLIKKQYLERYPVLKEIVDFQTDDKKIFDAKVKTILEQAYSINFVNIDKNYILEENNNWNLHFFQIYNKDFSENKKINSMENLHTMYFKALFEKENFNWWACFKLNSQWAEIFFREKSINEKKVKDLKTRNENAIEKKRYTENKVFLHLPITLNFINKWYSKYSFWYINDSVKKYIKENKMSIIWIDRWEKNLIYFSMINENLEIIELKSLNSLILKVSDLEEKEVNYFEKLSKKEWNRNKERKDWDEIETIKELKEWYISQIVDNLVKLIVKHNAIVVMEDLNSGFKRWRQKIEKQIYQKFELALAKKLNFTVDKNKKHDELWWIYKAYQLTPQIENFQDIYSQTWIIFYTQAAYTSVTCPNCSFRKNIYQKYENESKFKEFFKKYILEIKFEDNCFIIKYKIDEKIDKKKNKLKKLEFQVNTKNQIRLKFEKSLKWKWWETKEFNITEKFKEIFEKHKLDLWNLKEELLAWNWEIQLYKDFMFYFNLLLQLRNSKENDNWWYISCPSCWFHSGNWFQWFSYNWDANWAYNIARKWRIILDKIKKDEKNLWITNVEWDNYYQK